MGQSSSGRELAGKIHDFARAVGDPTAALNKTGMAGKVIFLGHMQAAGVSPGSKVAGKRKGISAGYDVKGTTVTIGYRGPAHLVNNPTRPHEILPRVRPGVSRRRRGARALVIAGNPRARASHPGTRGKRFYEMAKAVCERALPQVFAKAQLTDPLKRIFK